MAQMSVELMQSLRSNIACFSSDRIAYIGDFSKEALEVDLRNASIQKKFDILYYKKALKDLPYNILQDTQTNIKKSNYFLYYDIIFYMPENLSDFRAELESILANINFRRLFFIIFKNDLPKLYNSVDEDRFKIEFIAHSYDFEGKKIKIISLYDKSFYKIDKAKDFFNALKSNNYELNSSLLCEENIIKPQRLNDDILNRLKNGEFDFEYKIKELLKYYQEDRKKDFERISNLVKLDNKSLYILGIDNQEKMFERIKIINRYNITTYYSYFFYIFFEKYEDFLLNYYYIRSPFFEPALSDINFDFTLEFAKQIYKKSLVYLNEKRKDQLIKIFDMLSYYAENVDFKGKKLLIKADMKVDEANTFLKEKKKLRNVNKKRLKKPRFDLNEDENKIKYLHPTSLLVVDTLKALKLNLALNSDTSSFEFIKATHTSVSITFNFTKRLLNRFNLLVALLKGHIKNKKEAGMFFSEIDKKERDEIFNLYKNFDFKEL